MEEACAQSEARTRRELEVFVGGTKESGGALRRDVDEQARGLSSAMRDLGQEVQAREERIKDELRALLKHQKERQAQSHEEASAAYRTLEERLRSEIKVRMRAEELMGGKLDKLAGALETQLGRLESEVLAVEESLETGLMEAKGEVVAHAARDREAALEEVHRQRAEELQRVHEDISGTLQLYRFGTLV